jgi:hypothetical protein
MTERGKLNRVGFPSLRDKTAHRWETAAFCENRFWLTALER